MMMLSKLISLTLLLFTQFSRICGEEYFLKEIQISCVSNAFAEEFNHFHLKYYEKMATHNFKFHNGEIEKIKGMLGNREKIIFFFLGNQDHLQHSSGRHFQIAREQLRDTEACVCVVSYDCFSSCNLVTDLHYFEALKNRIPPVIDMATTFIQNIVDSTEFSIDLSSVRLSGYCLGGNLAGLQLKKIYNGQMVPTIWAFDPPWCGFNKTSQDGKPRLVQKGDARTVVIFHTSWIGIKESIGDIDIILNDGSKKSQPGCCSIDPLSFMCSHQAAFILRELIIQKSNRLLLEKGIPFATAKGSDDKCLLDFMNMPLNKKGTYYLRTGKIFGSK